MNTILQFFVITTFYTLCFITSSIRSGDVEGIEEKQLSKIIKSLATMQNLDISDSMNDKLTELIAKDAAIYNEKTVTNFENNNLFSCGLVEKCENMLGALKKFESESSSEFGLVIHKCNEKVYFIPKENVYYQDSWKHCCKWGMTPVTFQSQSELLCLYRAYSNLIVNQVVENNLFYTAIMDANLDRIFVDCQSQVPTSIFEELDNKEHSEPLIALSLNFDTFGLRDVPFNPDVNISVICEIPLLKKYNLQYEANISSFTFQSYVHSSIQYMISAKLYNCESAFCEDLSLTQQNIDLNAAGILVPGFGGKQYLFTENKVTFADSWTECCKWNMIPAVIENRDTLNLLRKNYNKTAMKNSALFYTSQLDFTFNRRFISCVSGNLVPREVFLPGEPDNKGKREACLAVKFDDKTSGFVDIRCGEFLNVICESTTDMTKYYSPPNFISKIQLTSTTTKQNIIQTTKTTAKPTETNIFTLFTFKTTLASEIRKKAFFAGKKGLKNTTIIKGNINTTKSNVTQGNMTKVINKNILHNSNMKVNSTTTLIKSTRDSSTLRSSPMPMSTRLNNSKNLTLKSVSYTTVNINNSKNKPLTTTKSLVKTNKI